MICKTCLLRSHTPLSVKALPLSIYVFVFLASLSRYRLQRRKGTSSLLIHMTQKLIHLSQVLYAQKCRYQQDGFAARVKPLLLELESNKKVKPHLNILYCICVSYREMVVKDRQHYVNGMGYERSCKDVCIGPKNSRVKSVLTFWKCSMLTHCS